MQGNARYVASLFALLRYLEVPQKRVATLLGLTKGAVSQLARGRRPIPEKHWPAFIAFVQDAVEEKVKQARAQDAQRGGRLRAVMRGVSAEKMAEMKIKEFFTLWCNEVSESCGLLYRQIGEEARLLKQLAEMDDDKIKRRLNEPGMRETFARSSRRVTAAIEALESVRPLYEFAAKQGVGNVREGRLSHPLNQQ
jgi:predicted transcriptional regulator